METYKYNEVVTCSVNIKVATVDTDPTGLTFYALDPSGNILKYIYGTDAEVVKDNTGDYHVNLTVNKIGIWTQRWESTGTAAGAGESEFRVEKSGFYPQRN